MIAIAPLAPEDRDQWEALARGYKAFYREAPSDQAYELAWRRLLAAEGIHGLCTRLDGRLVGIAHYLFHTTVWQGEACYLQDLFTAPETRGRGVARALIEAVADEAKRRGAGRYYWLTAEDNAVARALYDKVARFKGFVRYDYPV